MKSNNNILPYNNLCPVIYDNDSHCDVFTDELLMALASAGEINLKGIITTSPENECVNIETYELDAAGREEIVKMARRSGMKNIPDAVRGPSKPLVKPESGRIEDTIPLNSEGSRLIVAQALKATAEKPLVIVMGGPLTVIADAYLLDKSIVDNVVVSWLGGTLNDINDYNGVMDKWSAFIVIKKMKMIQFPCGIGVPLVTKEQLFELQDSELRQWMIDKRLPHVNVMPKGLFDDNDSQPVISLLNKEFIMEYTMMSFDKWGNSSQGIVPKYKEDLNGNIMVVTKSSQEIATLEWWKAMKNPKVWERDVKSKAKDQRTFYAAPFPIGKIERVEAEDFDHGGEGIAYHTENNMSFEKIYRPSNIEIVNAHDACGGYNMGQNGGYCITNLAYGNWLEYTINIEEEGTYEVIVRVASDMKGGSFHVEFDNENKTGTYDIPSTGGEYNWEDISKKDIFLKKGIQIMKIFVEGTGEYGTLGMINCIRLMKQR